MVVAIFALYFSLLKKEMYMYMTETQILKFKFMEFFLTKQYIIA